jgi:hypothetical protein
MNLPESPALIYRQLEAGGQRPRVEDSHDGCYVISFDHRSYPGRGRVYCAPGGSWTHSANRARQLAERFPPGARVA